jgi:hypothetical protein
MANPSTAAKKSPTRAIIGSTKRSQNHPPLYPELVFTMNKDKQPSTLAQAKKQSITTEVYGNNEGNWLSLSAHVLLDTQTVLYCSGIDNGMSWLFPQ